MNCVSKPSTVLDSIEPAFQQEFAVVASVSPMINKAGQNIYRLDRGIGEPPQYEITLS